MAIYDDYAVEDIGGIVDEVQRMEYIAPNLSALVGSAVAAKLTKGAGGLETFARMSPNNVPHFEYSVKDPETSEPRVAYLESTELYSLTPPESRKLCLRLLAGKSLVAARLDYTGQDPTGNTGRKLYDVIVRKLNLSC